MAQILFSIVIPTFKRQSRLKALLDSLALQAMPREKWEVVVVDDQSGEDLQPLVDAYTSTMAIRCVTSRVKGRPGTRNTGALVALGEQLIFLDDDVTVNSTFLECYERAHTEQPGCLVVGTIVSGDGDKCLWTVITNQRFQLHQKHASQTPDDLPFYCVITGNISIRRDLFNTLGGFDDITYRDYACEDFDFGLRAHKHGVRIRYNPGSVAAHHEGRVTLHELIVGLRFTKYGIVRFLNQHKDVLKDYGNYRNFDVRLGNTYSPKRHPIKALIKFILCIQPILEVAALCTEIIWYVTKSRAVLRIAVNIKELLEYRYYLRAAKTQWKDRN